jgi:hypothetical protein
MVGLALVAGWTVAGLFFADHLQSIPWLPKWGIVIAVAAPLLWIGIYTVQGIFGRGKWWQSDLGTNLVWLEAAAVVNGGTLVWAVFFHQGSIDTPISSWTYIGGLYAGAVIITWRSVIWLRTSRHEPPMLAKVRDLEAENTALRALLAERDLTIP